MNDTAGSGSRHDPGGLTGRAHLTVSAAPPASALRWRRVFPGVASELSVLRQWLCTLLPDCPARSDVLSVATELAGNAIQHTASGRGGWFVVELTWHETAVQVAVADCGSTAEPHVIDDPASESGRGLLLVRSLSLCTGFTGDYRGRLVWAQVAWHHPTAAVPPRDPYQAAVRDGEAALARSFSGVPAWFGRSTLAWWALAGPDRLISAPTARDLAGLLHGLLDMPGPCRSPAAGTKHQEASQQRDQARKPEPRSSERRPDPGPAEFCAAPGKATYACSAAMTTKR